MSETLYIGYVLVKPGYESSLLMLILTVGPPLDTYFCNPHNIGYMKKEPAVPERGGYSLAVITVEVLEM